jgi:hypothetical protein
MTIASCLPFSLLLARNGSNAGDIFDEVLNIFYFEILILQKTTTYKIILIELANSL